LLDRSYDLYDSSPNDPTSAAQVIALQYASQNIAKARVAPEEPATAPATAATATPARERNFLLGRFNNADLETTPRSSVAGSPAPDGRAGSPTAGNGGENGAAGAAGGAASADPLQDRMRAAEESDRVLPVMPLDAAIIASVRQAARGDDRKMRDFLGGVMVVGGGAKMPGFNQFLEVKLRESLPGFTKEIMVGVPPRELDQQLVVWKGGSVFGRLSSTGNDSWVHRKEYGILGAKLLIQKLMFAY
jgi:actin-related protein 8